MPVKIVKTSKKPSVKKMVQPKMTVDTEKGKGKEITNESVPMGTAVESTPEMCNVGMTLGGTRNLGDYENLKYTVSLFKPCMPEEADETFAEVKSWLDIKVAELNIEINEALSAK